MRNSEGTPFFDEAELERMCGESLKISEQLAQPGEVADFMPPLPPHVFSSFNSHQFLLFLIGMLSPVHLDGTGLTPKQLAWVLDQLVKYAELNTPPDHAAELAEVRAALHLPPTA